MEALQEPTDTLTSINGNQEAPTVPTSEQAVINGRSLRHDSTDRKKSDPLSEIEALQIKFFRILQRLGQSPEDILVAKVLYRIHLATLIRAGESDLKRVNLRSDKSRAIAAEQEAAGRPILDFSVRILVLGRTGVGKSATINSLFNQTKTMTDAFRPATDRIQEITGVVNGVKLSVIDTPGFRPSSVSNIRRNRKIMLSIKRYIRKFPPDVVLYIERLDSMGKGYSDFPLLRNVTEVFGPDMWFNTILVMTHSAAALPEGQNGFPLSYDSYVTHCSDLLQHYVRQAVSNAKLEIPVVLAENHPRCRTDMRGEKVLPNGQVWKQLLLLFCMCTKVLGDANAFLGLQGSIELGPSSNSLLPLRLPNLLSSFLRQCPMMNPDGTENVAEEFFLSVDEEEDEYDLLPPIHVLPKSQFAKLTDSQKFDYLDELDYRETLFLKKQLREESRRRREKKLVEDQTLHDEDDRDNTEAVQLPDMQAPQSFDPGSPIFRYRGIVLSDKWFWRPVVNPNGWDHDTGFDGVSLDSAAEIRKNVIAKVSGQMMKDKQDFTIHSQSSLAFEDPRGPMYSINLDVQSSGKDMVYTVHSYAKLPNMTRNVTGCGASVTSFQNKCFFGTKVEDTLNVGKRLKFAMNAGLLGGGGQGATYGGGVEATVRGRDYPIRNDKLSLGVTALSFDKELVLGGSFETELRPTRGMTLSVNASLNSQNMGQIIVKMSGTEHFGIPFLALFTIFRAISRRREPSPLGDEAREV